MLFRSLVEAIRARTPGTDPSEVVAVGWDGVRRRCAAYVEVGFSKLVLVPVHEPPDWDAELATAAEAVLGLQT